MKLGDDLLTWGVSGLLGVGSAFGYVKAKMGSLVSYEKHRDICSSVQTEVYEKIDKNHTQMIEILMLIKEDVGFLKGKIGE